MKELLPLFFCFLCFHSNGQDITLLVHDAVTNETLSNVTVKNNLTNKSGITKKDGTYKILNQQSGSAELTFSSIGYGDTSVTIAFPYNGPDSIPIYMHPVTKALEEVIVSSTR